MVRQIAVQVKTGEGDGAGTDGDVYLGLGGREFCLNIPDNDDFEPGDDVAYVFGEGSNVARPVENDPREGYVLHFEDLGRFPVYLRLYPRTAGDSWQVGRVHVRLSSDGGRAEFGILDHATAWLGRPFGLVLHLRRTG